MATKNIFSSDWPCCSPALWSLPPILMTSRSVTSVWRAVSLTGISILLGSIICLWHFLLINLPRRLSAPLLTHHNIELQNFHSINKEFCAKSWEQFKIRIFLLKGIGKFINCAKVHILLVSRDPSVVNISGVLVSHTTDDLIFEWYPPESIPLVVEPLQLPQLELIHNTTEDCTTSYSTGQMADMSRQ